jgi:membrane-associated phospholipid phosphatase
MLSQIDHDLILRLNSIVMDNEIFKIIAATLVDNPLIRGFPVLFPLLILWFSDDSHKRRSQMVIGLLATCLAVTLSILTQHYLSVHTRPFLDQTLSLKIYDRRVHELFFGNTSSFPSDTATFYFSICTIVFLERPLLGSIAMLWSLVASGLARVALGWHYPSDVIGSLVLGPGCVYLITKIKYLDILAERGLDIFKSHTYIIDSLFVIFVADAYDLFPGLRGILDILKKGQ